jgi:hypothetical protein
MKEKIKNITHELIIVPIENGSGFYHYIDFTYDEHIPFYVGKGKRGRLKRFFRGNKHDGFMKKHGILRIAFECMSEDHANFTEMLLIEKLRLFYYDKSLSLEENYWACNFTRGGEGISGYVFTPEQCASVGKAGIGRSPWNKGLKMEFTQEHCDNIAKANLGVKRPQSTCDAISKAKKGKPSKIKGIPFTEEHKNNLSKSRIEKGTAKGDKNPMAKVNRIKRLGKILLDFYDLNELWNSGTCVDKINT